MIKSPPVLQGIRDIADQFDGFMLDLYGLLHNGSTAYPDTVDTLQRLKDAGKRVCLLSNTPRMGTGSIEDLAAMGIDRGLYTDIVTAGDSAHEELRAHHQGKKIWFIGKDGFRQLIENIDLEETTPDCCDIIVNAVPSTPAIQHDILAPFASLAQANRTMICANPDLVVMIDGQKRYCSGTYAVAYEQAGGTVHYHGKPYTAVYDMALKKLGLVDRDKICVMGDALHTDIQGGHKNGFFSVMAMTGIHRPDVFPPALLGPLNIDIHYDPARLKTLMSTTEWVPNAIIPSFRWSS